MERVTPILREKVIDEAGNVLELAIWKVPVNVRYPEGIRYRLAYISFGGAAPEILYDNHAPKGHHRHFRGAEESYKFTDVDQLIADFRADVARLKRGS